MAQPQLIPKLYAPRVIEGTPSEIAEQLKTLEEHQRLTLIIPGEEIKRTQTTQRTEEPSAADTGTFAEILAPVHEYTRQSGISDEEIGDFVDAEIKAYRAEKRASAQTKPGAHE